MNKYRVGQVPKCGAMDSKYFSNPQQFDKDMQKHSFETEMFKSNLKSLILAEPTKIKDRYSQAIGIMLEIKTEYGL